MVPPRTPFFRLAHGSPATGLPPGKARLRPHSIARGYRPICRLSSEIPESFDRQLGDRVTKRLKSPRRTSVGLSKRRVAHEETVTATDPAIQVKTQEVEAGKAFDIIMTLAADKLKDGKLVADIEVKTNDKEQPSIKVPVTAEVGAAAAASQAG